MNNTASASKIFPDYFTTISQSKTISSTFNTTTIFFRVVASNQNQSHYVLFHFPANHVARLVKIPHPSDTVVTASYLYTTIVHSKQKQRRPNTHDTQLLSLQLANTSIKNTTHTHRYTHTQTHTRIDAIDKPCYAPR